MIRVKNVLRIDNCPDIKSVLKDYLFHDDLDFIRIKPLQPNSLLSPRDNMLLQWGNLDVVPHSSVYKEDNVEFETRWGSCIQVILQLSNLIPNASFIYAYASSDIGQDAGYIECKNGHITIAYIPKVDSKECFDISFAIWGDEVESSYIYVESKNTYTLKTEYKVKESTHEQ